jgi:Zn-dependent M28 family amino/carboxypeptidase
MRILTMAAACAIAFSTPVATVAAEFQPSPDRFRAHVQFLASDLMEGREAGTRGYDLAASYVANQFLALGLKPAGDQGSYLQNVPLLSFKAADQGSMTLTRKGQAPVQLTFGEDYLPGLIPVAGETRVSAPLVFVGYGITAPERGHNDYAGLNVKGKIAVVLAGAPSSFQTEERAHYNSGRTKRLAAEKAGAVGVLTVVTPTSEKGYNFARQAEGWQTSSMTWLKADGEAFRVAPTVANLGVISLKGAEKLFAGSRTSFADVVKASETPAGKTPRFALPANATVVSNSAVSPVKSANVAGLLEGSDPALKNEVVVLSAHLDHEGIGREVNGDKLYNGAMDNAAGIATMLEVARGFQESGERPKRSVLFLAVTAEEKGLVGAEYYAHNPTFPKTALVANVNLDMPVLNYDFVDVTAFGAERSSLGPLVQQAAARVGVALAPDPLPHEGLFTRSDHYRFVEQGVPAVFLMTGFGGQGREQFTKFLSERYHKPNDDLEQPIDWQAGAKFVKINYEIAREVAGAEQRPAWNKGDFFGEQFGRR